MLLILGAVLLGLLALAGLFWLVFYLVSNGSNGKIQSGGVTRRYILHVPAGLPAGSPVPLVITIHGYADWPEHQMKMSRWNDLADQNGFIVVYPMGTGFPRHWRTGADDGSAADVAFIADLIARLEQDYTIDRTRIYVNGLSNGGGMSHRLACELSDQIAAFGSVSGAYLYPAEACNPSRPMPLIAFHGTADPIVPYHGGPSASFNIPFPDVPEWMAAWAARNGCAATPQPLPAQGDVSGLRYTGCRENAEVHFYTVAGGGHIWPGGDPMPKFIVGHTTQDADATTLMWQFFSQYRLEK